MSASNEDDSLFAELSALALRYGDERVDTTWKLVQAKIAETKNHTIPLVMQLRIKDGDCVDAFLSLFSKILVPSPHHINHTHHLKRMLSLEFIGRPPEDTVMDDIATTLLASRERNLCSSLVPQLGEIFFPCNQRAYTHLIETGGSGLMDLFENVVLLGESNSGFGGPNTFPLIDHVLLCYIKERVLEKCFAKRLELKSCRLSMTEASILQTIIESDRLEDLKFSRIRVTPGEEPYVSASLIRGFRGPLLLESTQHQKLRNLQSLTLEDGILESLETTLVAPFFSAISTIESLRELTVGLEQTSILNALSACTFTALRKLSFSWGTESQIYPSFNGLFELVARSKELRSFKFDIGGDAEVDSSVTKQLFDLALKSGGSSLLEIRLMGIFSCNELCEWDLYQDSETENDVQIRRFDFLGRQASFFVDVDDDRLVRNLTTLLDLLKTRVCYLFELGLDEHDLRNFGWLFGHDNATLAISDEIKLQLERNRVGTKLLTVRPGIPRGLWPIILERFTNENVLRDVPWSGMYEIVQSLLTARDSVDDKTDDAVACDDDRRKRQRML